MEHNNEHTPKKNISFMHLLDLLRDDNELVEEDEDFYKPEKPLVVPRERLTVDEHFADQEWENRYKFPSEEYKIVGDISEIEKIINTCGFMNIDVSDLTSTLSKESINYVTVGYAEGPGFIANAFKDAWDKLPVENGGITDLLINIWVPKNTQSLWKEIGLMVDSFNLLPDDIDGIFWGCAWDESLNGHQAKVSLIAASK